VVYRLIETGEIRRFVYSGVKMSSVEKIT